MAYTIKRDIVVPSGYVSSNSGYVKPFRQSHAHSTGNPSSSVQNERDYLAAHYNLANFSFLVGITNGKVDIRQVAEVNQGSWDVGGDWNAEGFGTVEFVEGSIKSQADFKLAYPAYVWLLRKLNSDAGNKDMTLDTSNILGIKTHNYASATGHGSDHVDPLPFLAKWGISYAQFKKDIKNGLETKTVTVDTKNYPAAQAKVTGTLLTIKNASGVGVYTDKSLQAKYKRPVFLAKGSKVYASAIVQHGSTTRYKTALGYITAKKSLVSSSKVIE